MAQYLGETRKRRPFGIFQLILQVPIIALGILLAFWLNDRYTANNQPQEASTLQWNLQEINVNRSSLGQIIRAKENQITLIHKLIETGIRVVDSDSLRMAIPALLTQNTANVSAVTSLRQQLEIENQLNTVQRNLTFYLVAETADQNFLQNQLEPYFIERQVLSLLEPYQDSDAIDISDLQVNRIIRQLLNSRTFIDLVYARIHKIEASSLKLQDYQQSLGDALELIDSEIKKIDSE